MVSGKLPPVRVRVWFRVSVRIRVRGDFPWGAIVLEPYRIYLRKHFVYFGRNRSLFSMIRESIFF